MESINIISASAGTGKTYELARLLSEKISDGVEPETVLATTFTNKAADELKSRIRARLISGGLLEQAQRLDAAYIGTVNSVCGRLVTKFAFKLGLSPNLVVLDEDAAKSAMDRAIAEVSTETEIQELEELEFVLAEIGWRAQVMSIVTLARANNIAPEDLSASADQSVEEFFSLLPEAEEAESIERNVDEAIARFLQAIQDDGKKNTQSAIRIAREFAQKRQGGRAFPWQQWFKLAGISPAVAQKDIAEPLKQAAAMHDRHPLLRVQCERVIRLVFELAGRALAEYRRRKDELGALDFVDQETFALQLLEDSDAAEEIGRGLKLVLIDEFQDTNPIQLAIFLKLAELADESVWVGDQKQSIYEFRGADPALMGAVIERMESKGVDTQVLAASWRSRPGLVDLTSRLFTIAFAPHGLPEERVRIEAAEPFRDEPNELGPVLEHWSFDPGRKKFDPAAIAAGVRKLLEDATVRVRDRDSNAPRAVRASDVAILCRMHADCDAVAAALSALGVPAQRPHPGLLSTPEVRLVLAGLRYWVDNRDSVAMAEIARLLDYPENADDLLAMLIASPRAEGLACGELLTALRVLHDEHSGAGVVSLLDLVIECMEVREVCLRWGDARNRLDNIAALRIHTVNYATRCSAIGAGCTPTGLIGHLVQMHSDKEDRQGMLSGDDIVTVGTWHSAKGCEWPVTILCTLEDDRKQNALGVSIASERTDIDLDDPLADRWIRYWPNPYNPRTSKAAFFTRVGNHPVSQAIASAKSRERLRLLYVVWTRARDRLILVTSKGQVDKGFLDLLRDASAQPLLAKTDSGQLVVAGTEVDTVLRDVKQVAPVAAAVTPGEWYDYPDQPVPHPPRFISPSDIEACGNAGAPQSIGSRQPITGQPEMANLGNAVHAFLAADRPGLDAGARQGMAEGLLSRWQVSGAMQWDSLVQISDNLKLWIGSKWPDAVWHREWPVMATDDNGSTINGIADLVLETEAGFVVIDHKSFPGNQEQAMERVRGYAGQLLLYAQVIAAATKKEALGTYIHLPISGMVVSVAEA